ncbi:mediator of RNA polymerase II transcription subunit 13 [Leguminivora glycinivorella]|uniref:mediator of RNA polymerase II transcription subunit 13 n=1 Tax=Leguminivora glycinivorella TaxID=1035111 RepID=UPI00200CBB3B|nr:mediator of RNA polymerase II transcription subunit 13 [Leguminivora glycinivorella]
MLYDYTTVHAWLEHPVKRFKSDENTFREELALGSTGGDLYAGHDHTRMAVMPDHADVKHDHDDAAYKNLYTSDGLCPTLKDLDQIFENSDDAASGDETVRLLQVQTPPDSNKSFEETRGRMVRAEELSKMFPTPPSLEAHAAPSPGFTLELEPLRHAHSHAHAHLTPHATPPHEPIEDWSYVFKPPTVYKCVGSSKYAPLLSLPSSSLPPVNLPPHAVYRPRWQQSEEEPQPQTGTKRPASPLASPGKPPPATPAPAPAAPAPPAPSPRAATPAPPPRHPRAACRACPLLLNVLLADTVLNVFRDHNFDSCTLCVCNAGPKVVGNIRGADASTYLPESAEATDDDPGRCTCGFSAVVNRRLAHKAGLFYESAEATDDDPGRCTCGFSAVVNRRLAHKAGLFYEVTTSYLPESAEATDDDPGRCTCGFSAVVNRRLAHKAGLFYEDEMEITGIAEIPGRNSTRSLGAVAGAVLGMCAALGGGGASALTRAARHAARERHDQDDINLLDRGAVAGAVLGMCAALGGGGASALTRAARHAARERHDQDDINLLDRGAVAGAVLGMCAALGGGGASALTRAARHAARERHDQDDINLLDRGAVAGAVLGMCAALGGGGASALTRAARHAARERHDQDDINLLDRGAVAGAVLGMCAALGGGGASALTRAARHAARERHDQDDINLLDRGAVAGAVLGMCAALGGGGASALTRAARHAARERHDQDDINLLDRGAVAGAVLGMCAALGGGGASALTRAARHAARERHDQDDINLLDRGAVAGAVLGMCAALGGGGASALTRAARHAARERHDQDDINLLDRGAVAGAVLGMCAALGGGGASALTRAARHACGAVRGVAGPWPAPCSACARRSAAAAPPRSPAPPATRRASATTRTTSTCSSEYTVYSAELCAESRGRGRRRARHVRGARRRRRLRAHPRRPPRGARAPRPGRHQPARVSILCTVRSCARSRGAVAGAVLGMCAALGGGGASALTRAARHAARERHDQDDINLLEYSDGGAACARALRAAAGAAAGGAVHRWPFIGARAPRCSRDVIRLMRRLRPLLQDAIQKRCCGARMWDGVAGPLTWRQFHRLAGRSNEDLCEPQPVPPLLVGHDRDWISLSPYALRHWERLALEPYSYSRDVAYVVLAPDGEVLTDPIKTFFRELSTAYESCRLGRHQPINRIARDGLIRTSPSDRDQTAEEWTGELPAGRLGEYIKSYAETLRTSLVPQLASLSIDRSLLETENKSTHIERPSPSPMRPPSTPDHPPTPSSQSDQENETPNTSSSANNSTVHNSWEEEEGGAPALVIYVVEPPASHAHRAHALHALLRLAARTHHHLRHHNPLVKIISLEGICETAGLGAGTRSELRALAFSVFTGARRLLQPAPAGKSLTGFGTAAQARVLLDAMQEKDRAPYKLFSPAWVLAPPRALKEVAETWGHSCGEQGAVLFLSYCLSHDQRWLFAAATDARGELLDTHAVNIHVPHRSRRRRALGARRCGLTKLMDWALGVMSQAAQPWRLVVGRLGRIGHGELKGWSWLLSRKNLTRASNQLKDICNPCSVLYPSGAPCILSACLVSTEPDSCLRLMADRFTPDERFSQASIQSHLHTPRDVTATHILVFPTSATATQSAQGQFEQSAMANGETDDMMFLGVDMNDMNDDEISDSNMTDLLIGDMFNNMWPQGSPRNDGGREEDAAADEDEPQRSVPQASYAGDDHSQEQVGTVLQQPLALGYMVSTAPLDAMPAWWWAGCSHLRDACPAFLKSALHLHTGSVQAADDFTSLTQRSSHLHPLDSQVTTDVLRYVLEGYNALSWLALDGETHDRRSCLPLHVQVLMQLYHTAAALG